MTIGCLIGVGDFCHQHKQKKKKRRSKSSKKRKLTKNVWGAASELQLKNRIEKKIKEIEKKKKYREEN